MGVFYVIFFKSPNIGYMLHLTPSVVDHAYFIDFGVQVLYPCTVDNFVVCCADSILILDLL